MFVHPQHCHQVRMDVHDRTKQVFEWQIMFIAVNSQNTYEISKVALKFFSCMYTTKIQKFHRNWFTVFIIWEAHKNTFAGIITKNNYSYSWLYSTTKTITVYFVVYILVVLVFSYLCVTTVSFCPLKGSNRRPFPFISNLSRFQTITAERNVKINFPRVN